MFNFSGKVRYWLYFWDELSLIEFGADRQEYYSNRPDLTIHVPKEIHGRIPKEFVMLKELL